MRLDKFRRIIGPAGLGLAVLFALGAPVSAQGRDPKAPEKPAATPAAPATPATPAAAKVQSSGDSTSVAVTGLTKDNTAATKAALEGLSHTVYRCPACNMTQADKGTCSMCKKELVSEKSTALKNITLDAEKGTIGFALAPGQAVRLTEIETALTGEKISIPRDKLTIGPNSTLMVSGVSSEESVSKLEAELKSSKLFDSVKARLVGTGKPAELTVKGGGAPATRAKVEEALAKAGPDFKLVDIVWTSPSAAPATPAAPKSKG
jgi:hypothetical protein